MFKCFIFSFVLANHVLSAASDFTNNGHDRHGSSREDSIECYRSAFGNRGGRNLNHVNAINLCRGVPAQKISEVINCYYNYVEGPASLPPERAVGLCNGFDYDRHNGDRHCNSGSSREDSIECYRNAFGARGGRNMAHDDAVNLCRGVKAQQINDVISCYYNYVEGPASFSPERAVGFCNGYGHGYCDGGSSREDSIDCYRKAISNRGGRNMAHTTAVNLCRGVRAQKIDEVINCYYNYVEGPASLPPERAVGLCNGF